MSFETIVTIAVVAAVVLLMIQVLWRRTELVSTAGPRPRPGTETQADVDRLIQTGRKIEAIKVHRALYGTDLKEAKEAVEARAREIAAGGRPEPIG